MAVFEIREKDFESKVLRDSHNKVIIVDFWAEWCGPCRTLGPVLERLAESYGGRVILAKVNVDENRTLAAQWEIRSIPAVKIFKAGKVIEEFTGNLPESDIIKRLSAVIPTEADEFVSQADRMVREGDNDRAETWYRKALACDDKNERAFLGMAALAVQRSEYTAALQWAGRINGFSDEYKGARAIVNRIHFLHVCKDNGGRQTCETALRNEPDDTDLRFNLACCLAAAEEYKGALDLLLEIMRTGGPDNKKAGREAMLRIFDMAGEECGLVSEYRARLYGLLY